MSSVYELAHEVIAVISSPTDDTDFLLDHKMWDKTTMSSQNIIMNKGMMKLMADDYWRRTWILQELVLGQARLFCCGKRLVTFEELVELCGRVFDMSELGLGADQVLQNFGRLLKVYAKRDLTSHGDRHAGSNNGSLILRDEMEILTSDGAAKYRNMSFLDLWIASGGFNRCSDPKDILYARRGLSNDGVKLIPTVDYSPDRSMEDVYKEFAMRCITNASKEQLRVITHGDWDPIVDASNLPSWIPDCMYIQRFCHSLFW